MDVTCISDLHGHYPQLEGGDLLIVAGDLTAHDQLNEHVKFDEWVQDQLYRKVIVIGGNHDVAVQKGFLPRHCTYLCDSGTEFEYSEEYEPEATGSCRPDCKFFRTKKLKIWGSPWTKRFEGINPKCMAFTVDTDEELAEKWAMIPDDTDILVTHCPPFMVLDQINNGKMLSVGSISLRAKSSKIQPKLHVFGHIHESYGQDKFARGAPGSINHERIFVNASHVNECYEPVNKPIRIEL